MLAVTSNAIQTTPAFQSPADELVIETPERVELYYTRAQVGNRFLAAAIDHLIQFAMIGAIGLGVYLSRDTLEAIWDQLGVWTLGLAVLATFAIYTGYFVLFETIWNGQTPGKRLFRLRVIREDGRPIRFYEAMVRNLLRTSVDAMPSLYSVGIVSIFLSPRSKRVGDYVAGTVVVRESEARAPSLDDIVALARAEANKDFAASTSRFPVDPDLLTADDYLALRAFLRRRYDLSEPIRVSLGNRLASSFASRLRIPALPMSAEELLEEVDRQSRTRRSYRDEID